MDQQLDLHVSCLRFIVITGLTASVWGCGSSRLETGRVALNVLTVNVISDDSTDSRAVAHRIADVIRDLNPDVVALQGIRRDVVQSDAFDFLTTLSDLTGMAYAFGETSASHAQRIGNGFLTRHPILEERNTAYSKDNGLLRLTLEVGGNEVMVLTTLVDDGTGETGKDLRKMIQEIPAGPKVFLASSEGDANGGAIKALKEILKDASERVGTGPEHTAPGGKPAKKADYVLFSEGSPGLRPISARLLEVAPPTRMALWVEFEFVAN